MLNLPLKSEESTKVDKIVEETNPKISHQEICPLSLKSCDTHIF